MLISLTKCTEMAKFIGLLKCIVILIIIVKYIYIYLLVGRKFKGQNMFFLLLHFSVFSRHDIIYFEAPDGFYPTNATNAPI